MFFELLSDCTIRSFSKALVSNSQELIKCVSLTNRPCEVRRTLVNINSMKVSLIHLLSVLISVVQLMQYY